MPDTARVSTLRHSDTARHCPTPRHSDTPTLSTLSTLSKEVHCQESPTLADTTPTLPRHCPDTARHPDTSVNRHCPDTAPTLPRHYPDTAPTLLDTPTLRHCRAQEPRRRPGFTGTLCLWFYYGFTHFSDAGYFFCAFARRAAPHVYVTRTQHVPVAWSTFWRVHFALVRYILQSGRVRSGPVCLSGSGHITSVHLWFCATLSFFPGTNRMLPNNASHLFPTQLSFSSSLGLLSAR